MAEPAPQDLTLLRHLVRTQSAGLSWLESLQMWHDTCPGAHAKRRAQLLMERMRRGQSLSDALARMGGLSGTALALSRVAEHNGIWAAEMKRWLQQHDLKEKRLRQARSAWSYPLVVLLLAGAVMTGVMTWVLPTFETLYGSMNIALPGPTRWLMALHQALSAWGWHAATLFACSGLLVVTGMRQPVWQARLDALIWHLPWLGAWRRMQIESRWCALLAHLVDAGLDWASALELGGSAVGSPVMARACVQIRMGLAAGRSLGEAMGSCPMPWQFQTHGLFSPMLTQWVKSGEATGTVSEVLGQWATLQDEAWRSHADLALRLIEPALMGLLGLLMGWLVLALYLPVLQMGQAL